MEFEDGLPDDLCIAALETVESMQLTDPILESFHSMGDLSDVDWDSIPSSLESHSRGVNILEPANGLIIEENIASKVAISLPPCQTETNDHVMNEPSSSKSFAPFHEFDEQAGLHWIYPIDYPVREYQLNIVQKALFHNTLVTLPTGMGKTFIAAVVMYNFYRWFPKGKVLFMAPTRPLVAQQIEACQKIVDIPAEDIIELTGSNAPEERRNSWREKRMFFLTPQVLVNDLHRDSCCANQIVCVVLDEAHRALGEHAYCIAIRSLNEVHQQFRVLALSATPGSDGEAARQVIQNLHIAHLEIRTDESLDLRDYIHEKRTEVICIPLGEELTNIRDRFIDLLKKYIHRLCHAKVLFESDIEKITQGVLLRARDLFRSSSVFANASARHSTIEGDFAVSISLCHALHLLYQHGARSFLQALKNILDDAQHANRISRSKTELIQNPEFLALIDFVETRFRDPSFRSHEKLHRLEQIIMEYFHESNCNRYEDDDRRVMIFSQYRNSVSEIVDMLSQHKEVRVASFIGQSSTGRSKGFSQKKQLEVIQRFREGHYNTLVATSIGEEGLDIGEIDLILCFDAQFSVVRTLQRIGRTGRQREGRIIMLLTEGKEEQIYRKSQVAHKSVQRSMISEVTRAVLSRESPRMIPSNCHPVLRKVTMSTMTRGTKSTSGVDRRQNSSQFAFDRFRLIHLSRSPCPGPYLSWNETLEWKRRYKLNPDDTLPELRLNAWIEHQVMPSAIYQIPHSKRTLQFIELLSRTYTSFAKKRILEKGPSIHEKAISNERQVGFVWNTSRPTRPTYGTLGKEPLSEPVLSDTFLWTDDGSSSIIENPKMFAENPCLFSPDGLEELEGPYSIRQKGTLSRGCLSSEIDCSIKMGLRQNENLSGHMTNRGIVDGSNETSFPKTLNHCIDGVSVSCGTDEGQTRKDLSKGSNFSGPESFQVSVCQLPSSLVSIDQEGVNTLRIVSRRRKTALVVTSQEEPCPLSSSLAPDRQLPHPVDGYTSSSDDVDGLTRRNLMKRRKRTVIVTPDLVVVKRGPKNRFIDDEVSLDNDGKRYTSSDDEVLNEITSSLSGFVVPDDVMTTPSNLTGIDSKSSPIDMTSFYQQSLLSPSNMFFHSKLHRIGNRFKMVFGAKTPSSLTSDDPVLDDEGSHVNYEISTSTSIDEDH